MRQLWNLVFALAPLASQAQAYWHERTSCPDVPRWGVECFQLNGIGYMVGGRSGSTDLDEVWAYDPLSDSWSERAPIPGVRRVACAFAINGKGYVSCGLYDVSSIRNDLWEYDPVADSWTQRADLPSAPRYGCTAFVLNGVAYIFGGSIGSGSGPYVAELWAYDPVLDQWSERSPMPDQARVGPSSFVGNGTGFVFGGRLEDQSMSNDLWAYDAVTDSWESKQALPTPGRHYARAYELDNRGLIISGLNSVGTYDEAWIYSPWGDSWLSLPPYPGGGGWSGAHFSINGRIFAGLGLTGAFSYADLWELIDIPLGLAQTDQLAGSIVTPTVVSPGDPMIIDHPCLDREQLLVTVTDQQGRCSNMGVITSRNDRLITPSLAAGAYLVTVHPHALPPVHTRILVLGR